MRRFHCISLVILVLAISGCSTLHEFFIINITKQEVELTVSYDSDERREFHVTSEDRVLESDKSWKRVPNDRVKVGPEGRAYTLVLRPNEVLKVLDKYNYTGHQNESFEINEIILTVGDTTKTLVGKQVQEAFKKGGKRADYALTIKG